MAVTDAFVNFGTEYEFLSADGSQYNSIGVLGDSTFLISYDDASDSYKGKSRIASVSGTTINYGSIYEYINVSGIGNYVDTAVLSSSKFVLAFQDETDLGHGTLRAGTVSGTTITFGAATEFLSTGRAAYISIATLDDSSFVVSYADWSDSRKGKMRVGTVSGTTISLGSEITFYSLNEAINTRVASFGASKFVLCYKQGNAGDLQGTARIGTVSGTTISLGSEVDFTNIVDSSEFSIDVDTLTSSKFVVCYRDSNDSEHGTAKIGTVSGTTITFGTETEFLPSGAVSNITVEGINNINFAVAYQDEADSNHGTIKIGTIEDTDITFGDESEFLSTNGTNYINLGILSTSKVVVAYTDVVNSNHGTAKIGSTTIGSIVASGEALRIIHRLTKIQDYDPQLINTFTGTPLSVNIEVWDVGDGQNTVIPITSSGCYAIGDTGAWGWSTINLPFTQGDKKYHYYYRMTSDEDEFQYGEFLITVPERGLWSYLDWGG